MLTVITQRNWTRHSLACIAAVCMLTKTLGPIKSVMHIQLQLNQFAVCIAHEMGSPMICEFAEEGAQS